MTFSLKVAVLGSDSIALTRPIIFLRHMVATSRFWLHLTINQRLYLCAKLLTSQQPGRNWVE